MRMRMLPWLYLAENCAGSFSVPELSKEFSIELCLVECIMCLPTCMCSGVLFPHTKYILILCVPESPLLHRSAVRMQSRPIGLQRIYADKTSPIPMS